MPYPEPTEENVQPTNVKTNNWHIDSYGDKMEQSHGYVNHMRQCKMAFPTINERLESYIPRLRRTLQENGEISYSSHISPKMWYTHKTGRCWICDSDSIANISLDVLEQTIEIKPKLKNLQFLQYGNTGLKLQET